MESNSVSQQLRLIALRMALNIAEEFEPFDGDVLDDQSRNIRMTLESADCRIRENDRFQKGDDADAGITSGVGDAGDCYANFVVASKKVTSILALANGDEGLVKSQITQPLEAFIETYRVKN